MRALRDKRVLLGVTGGIAAYKAALLARALAKAGARVQVAVTQAATRFVTPLTFEALTGRPCLTDEALWAGGGAVTHVATARETDLIVIAPASANTLGKIANGLADNLLTTTVMACRAPVLLVPSMHTEMWQSEGVQANLGRLGARFRVMTPAVGELASGDRGEGRFPEIDDIVAEAAATATPQDLKGVRVVVTAGPTREPIDAVRVITNPSTGRMGIELARMAQTRGADVILVLGPTDVPTPPALSAGRGTLRVVRVETAQEMLEAVRGALPGARALLMSAAVADERPVTAVVRKLHKAELPATLELEPTPDILLTLRPELKGKVVLGFAAETDDVEASGRRKLEAKNLDLLFANVVGRDRGFGAVPAEGVLLAADGCQREIPPMRKRDLADELLDEVASRLKALGTQDGGDRA